MPHSESGNFEVASRADRPGYDKLDLGAAVEWQRALLPPSCTLVAIHTKRLTSKVGNGDNKVIVARI